MQLHLIAHSGYANETQAPIEGWFGTEGGTVGRDPRCNMVLVDPMRRISRIQAQIIWENNAFHLLNASTSNPIYVNGRELAPGARLAIGAKDEWRTGNYVISVEQATHAASAPSALVAQTPVRREASDAASVLQPVEPHSASPHVPSDAAGLLPPQPLASPIIEKHQGSASALRGPFDDLLSTPVEQPSAAQAYTAENNAAQAHLPGDPFAMPTAPIQQPAGRSSSPASRSDPFADLMSGPIDAQLSSAPASQIKRGTSSVIPDDFNPMASGGVAHRNIDDPLQNMFQSGNVKEMFPERSFDAIFQPNEGSIDSMTIDPLHTDKHQSFMDASTKVDPLDLFSRERVAGDLNPEVLFGNDKPGGPVQRDHTSEMGSYFRAPRALHEETLANDAVSERPLPSAASSAEELPDPLAPFSPASAPPAHPTHAMAETRLSVPPPLPSADPTPPTALPQPAPPSRVESLDVFFDLGGPSDNTVLGQELTPLPPSVAESIHPMHDPVEPQPAPLLPTDGPQLQERVPTTNAALQAEASAPPSESDQELLAAFKRGAGLSDCRYPQQLTADMMYMIGQMLSGSVQGYMDLLGSRAATKQEVRIAVTLINAEANNPLKFLPTGGAALAQIFGPKMPGFLPGPAAIENARLDLRAHEVGMMAGTQAAVQGLFERFDPRIIEEQLDAQGRQRTLFAAQRNARLWEMYCNYYRWLKDEMKNQTPASWGAEFHSAYQTETESIESKGTSK